MKGDVYDVGDLVFAKVRGYPAWPARVTAIAENVKPKKYSIFFFGTYEVALLKAEELTTYTQETRDAMCKQNIKRKHYAEALEEIEAEPNMQPRGPPLMPKPSTPKPNTPKQNTPKHNTPKPNIPRQTISQTTTPKPATPGTAEAAGGTPKPRGRKRKEEGTPTVTPGPASKRSKPTADEAAVVEEEQVHSRSGRKIKPKRFADADESPAAGATTPAGLETTAAPAASGSVKRRGRPPAVRTTDSHTDAGSSSMNGQLANDSAATADASDETAAAAEDERAAAAEDETAAAAESAGGVEEMEAEEPAPGDLPVERAHTASGDGPPPDSSEFVNLVRLVDDSAEVEQLPAGKKVMRVRAKCGSLLEVDLSDPDRPKQFKSERARIMWDVATEINTRRMIHRLENGEYVPDHLRAKMMARGGIAYEERQSLKDMKKQELAIARKMWYHLEVKLVDIDYRIKSNLVVDQQDEKGCLRALEDLLELSLAPLMVKKYPEVVDTVRKCRRYVHNEEIRNLADKCYTKLKKLFVVPTGKTFRLYFDELVAQFRLYTKDMSEDELALLYRDPLFSNPDKPASESEGDDDREQQSAPVSADGDTGDDGSAAVERDESGAVAGAAGDGDGGSAALERDESGAVAGAAGDGDAEPQETVAAQTETDIERRADDTTAADEPTKEDKANEPTKEDKANEPTEDDKADEPTEDDKADEPTEDAKADEPTKDVKADEPTEDAKADEPTKDVKADEPTEDAKADEPIEDAKADEPTEDAKTTDEPTEDAKTTDEPTENNDPAEDTGSAEDESLSKPAEDVDMDEGNDASSAAAERGEEAASGTVPADDGGEAVVEESAADAVIAE